MNRIYQLPIDVKIDKPDFDVESFMKKVYSKVTDLAEEEGIEVVSDCWYTDISSSSP